MPDTAPKSAKRVKIRIKPGSPVDVVDLEGVQVRAGEVVELSSKDAAEALKASLVLVKVPPKG